MEEIVAMGRPPKIKIDTDQPQWTCYECGRKYGSFKCGIATWHQDDCGACGKHTSVTEPRDFGYFLEGWKDKRDGKEQE
jgi:rRNA maturation protein Nop10